MNTVEKNIEKINIEHQLFNTMYRKTGLYIIYPFLLIIILLMVSLFFIEKDLVIELTGTISNPHTGFILSNSLTGNIDEIYIDNHQNVNAGDIILKLNSEEIENRIEKKMMKYAK